MKRIQWLASIIGLLVLAGSPAMAELPGNSIYHLNSQWKNQNSDLVALNDLAGKKLVLSMTYTSCQHTCPTIVANMQALERALSPDERENTGFVLVSLSPDVDTPSVLKAYEEKRGLQKWTLLTGSNEDVRALAMTLNVRYKPAGNGEVSHSNLINILSADGALQFAVSGVSETSADALQYLQE